MFDHGFSQGWEVLIGAHLAKIGSGGQSKSRRRLKIKFARPEQFCTPDLGCAKMTRRTPP